MTQTEIPTILENYFQPFRNNIIGIDQEFVSPFGKQKIIYTDWTASGRLYRPIEEKLMNDFGPFVANTHTETTVSGTVASVAPTCNDPVKYYQYYNPDVPADQ